jgi:para-nitrobenzyl esterase
MKSKQQGLDRRSFMGRGAVAAGVLTGGVLNKAIAAAKNEGSSAGPVVETVAGKIRGVVLNKIYAFRGVPYGASTAGEGRFMPPSKPQPWTGVKDTIELGIRSPQLPGGEPPEVIVMDRREPMGEDCLMLNVWTPSVRGGSKRPVILWLHGGGYATGSAGFIMYDGANFARKQDAVFVGVNHRLNVFGYLYLAGLGGAKYAQSANIGQMDIIAALEWVRDNISRFGGDPNNVTICGQSGGGGKVSNLLAMPAAKGLFHRAIIQSGANLRSTEIEDANKSTETFLAKLNLRANQIDELQKMPMQQLLDAMKGTQGLRLAPVVDGKTLPAHPFDPAAPEVSAKVPILLGTMETEDTFFAGTPVDDMDDATLHQRVKQALRSDDADADRTIGVYRRVFSKITNIDVYLKMLADNTRRANAIALADRKMALAKAPAYLYYFTWRSPIRDGKMKAYHTLEIPFAFDNVDEAKSMTGDSQERYPLQDRVSGAWAAFARTGNPSHKGLPNWPAYNAEQRPTMILNTQCKVVNDPHHEERLALASVKRAGGAA